MAKSSNKKAIIAVGAVVVVAGLTVAAAIGSEGFKNKNFKSWFNNWGKGGTEITAPSDTQPTDGIMLLSSTIAANDYAAYGVSEKAISAKTLTAEFTPANATDKRVNWSLAWDNPADSWAKGKTVTDYVTLTPGTNYAPSATVSVLQSFGESIIVTCTSRANSSLSDNCKLEYVARTTADGGDDAYITHYTGIGITDPFDCVVELFHDVDAEGESIVGAYTVCPTSYNARFEISYQGSEYLEFVYPEDYADGNDVNVNFSKSGQWASNTPETSANLTIRQILGSLLDDPDKMQAYAAKCSASMGSSNQVYLGCYTVVVDCCYGGEKVYDFKRSGELYILSDVLELMSIPATDITVTDKVIPF